MGAAGGQVGAPSLPAPPTGSRISRSALIAVVVGVLVGVAVVAVVIVAMVGPSQVDPCVPGAPCPGPPERLPLVAGTIWRSEPLGVQLEYEQLRWSVQSSDDSGLVLVLEDGFPNGTLWISASSADVSPDALLQQQLASLHASILGLTADTDPQHALLGANIGYISGPGGVYVGTLDGGQGPVAQVSVVSMAATDGEVSAAVSLITTEPDGMTKRQALDAADSILNTFIWPEGPLP